MYNHRTPAPLPSLPGRQFPDREPMAYWRGSYAAQHTEAKLRNNSKPNKQELIQLVLSGAPGLLYCVELEFFYNFAGENVIEATGTNGFPKSSQGCDVAPADRGEPLGELRPGRLS